jgi:RNA polymerase subunit RPABC4/transcription elongation factor Spt4
MKSKEGRKMIKTEQCPKCGSNMKRPRVALSRRDNKTNICPPCGTREAMEDFMKSRKGEP